MFRIIAVNGPRINVQFNHSEAWGSHKVSVITGLNGSGKTELLTSLASYFRSLGRTPPGLTVKWDKVENRKRSTIASSIPDGPARVITQTFSPFSRFAAPKDERLTLTEIYAEGKEQSQRYRSIGFHKKSKYIGGVLSKHTLEQGLFRLSESPEQTRALAGVLESLGFRDSMHLVYRKYPTMRKLLLEYSRGDLRRYLESLNSPSERLAGATLAREVRITGSERLAELLEGALDVLSQQLKKSSFELFFSFSDGHPSEDYAVMQALALLRRLRVLRLDQCRLALASEKQSIDLADASSGQQQMLCSIFGLVAELTSDSLVLIDEPELSLHPTWQMSFLERLEAVLRQFDGCHVVIATHSPLIVQSAMQQNLEIVQLQPPENSMELVGTLTQDEKQVSVEGALLNVFHTPIPSSVYLANEIFDIVAEGEEGGDVARLTSLERLGKLRSLYSGEAKRGDNRALRLIEEAITLLETNDNEEAPDAV